MNSYYIKVLTGIFTVDNGKIKILLMKKNDNPYKGYWTLPSKFISNSLENTAEEIINDIGLPPIYYNQVKTYNSTETNEITISYIGIIDSITYMLKKQQNDNIELEWFDINAIPKIAYDYQFIINELFDNFKTQIKNDSFIKLLFPSDFTLPELQEVYEQILDKKLDRRNFRKKIFSLGNIIDTGDVTEGLTGRPAKLYKFKE